MARFPTTLRGYDRSQVDAVFARVDGTLGRVPLTAPPVTPEELGATRFRTALRGYDRAAVDRALRDAAAALGGASQPPPGDAPPPVPVPDDPPEAARDRILARLRAPGLSVVKLGPGYAQADVDRFLDYAVAALTGSARPLTPGAVHAAQFAGTRLGGGYDEESVDDLLDELVAYLERYGSG